MIEVVSIVDVLERNGSRCESSKRRRGVFAEGLCNVESIHKEGCPAFHLVSETVKDLIARWMVKVPASLV